MICIAVGWLRWVPGPGGDFDFRFPRFLLRCWFLFLLPVSLCFKVLAAGGRPSDASEASEASEAREASKTRQDHTGQDEPANSNFIFRRRSFKLPKNNTSIGFFSLLVIRLFKESE